MPETFEKLKDLKCSPRQKYVVLLCIKRVAWSIGFIISLQYDAVVIGWAKDDLS